MDAGEQKPVQFRHLLQTLYYRHVTHRICRYLHQPTAVEVFFSSSPSSRSSDWSETSRRHSVFLHFPSESRSDSRRLSASDVTLPALSSSPVRVFYNAIKSLCSRDQLSVCYLTNARDAFAATGIHKKWLAGHVTNFDYIMALNTFSGRSLNDLRQYPVCFQAPQLLLALRFQTNGVVVTCIFQWSFESSR